MLRKTSLPNNDSTDILDSQNSSLPVGTQNWKIVDYKKGATVSIADDGNYILFAKSKQQFKDEITQKLQCSIQDVAK